VGHRAGRDPRLTTHVALTARALGAARLYLHPPDPELAERIAAVGRRWGGRFEVVGAPEWKKVVRGFDGPIVHLTMYGEPIDEVARAVRRSPRVLVVVGGAKVPAELYRLSTRNAAAGHQPHSEVAALALLLDRLVGIPPAGRWPGARQEIVPSARGKSVRTHERPTGAP
jgi:tRNA (cytidine56-2'-O)-methyltransferase